MAGILDLGAVQSAANQALQGVQPANILGAYQTMAQLQNARLQQQNIMAELAQRQLEFGLKQASAQRTLQMSQDIQNETAAGRDWTDPAFIKKLVGKYPGEAMALQEQLDKQAEQHSKMLKDRWLIIPNYGAVYIGDNGLPVTPPPGATPPPGVPLASASASPTPANQEAPGPTAAPSAAATAPTDQAAAPPTPNLLAVPTTGGLGIPAVPAQAPLQPSAPVTAQASPYFIPELTPEQRNFNAKYQDYLAATGQPNTPANRFKFQSIAPTLGKEGEIALQQAHTREAIANAVVNEAKAGNMKAVATPELTQSAINAIAPVDTPANEKLFGVTNSRYSNELKQFVDSGSFTPAVGADLVARARDETKQVAVQAQTVGPKIEVGGTVAALQATAPGAAGQATAGLGPKTAEAARAQVTKANDLMNSALAAADDMKTFIDSARAGNKIAYAYAPVEGVLTLNTARGVKRVNLNEIGGYGAAGSALDRLRGYLGKQASGASIPPDILNDMESIHKAIADNAEKARDRSIQSINQTYGSSFPTAAPKPTGGSSTDRIRERLGLPPK